MSHGKECALGCDSSQGFGSDSKPRCRSAHKTGSQTKRGECGMVYNRY